MVVNRDDPGDIEIGHGRLTVNSDSYPVTVYGDSITGSGTVFPPDELTERPGRVPGAATVTVTSVRSSKVSSRIRGKTFRAEQGFRYGRQGQSIPVYDFNASRFITGEQRREQIGNDVIAGDIPSIGAALMDASGGDPDPLFPDPENSGGDTLLDEVL